MIELADDNDLVSEMGRDHSAFYRPWIEPIQHLGWTLGYAIGVHGSLKRDLDMIAMPWVVDACSDLALARAVCQLIDGKLSLDPRHNPGLKPHGRRTWSIHFFGGNYDLIHRYIDLSVCPRLTRES